MKHEVSVTVKLLLWAAFGVLLSFIVAPIVKVNSSILEQSAPGLVAVYIVAILIFSAVFWTLMLSKLNPTNVDWIFIIVLALSAASLAVDAMLLIHVKEMVARVLGVLLYGTFMVFLWQVVRYMQKSWEFTRKNNWIWNLFFIITCAAVAAKVGQMLMPIVAIGILVVFAVYDFWAVNKSKTMIKIAEFFCERRILPGIAIAKEEEGKFAILGGGDIFFIGVIATSFMATSMLTAILTAIGMFTSVVVLFFASEKGKFYPALPTILSGCVLSLMVAWLII